MRKIKINPKYEYLKDFLESIPDVFEKEGRVIYTGRNLIKVLIAPDGTQVNVKRFHIPHGQNKLIYSWNIRKPPSARIHLIIYGRITDGSEPGRSSTSDMRW